MICPHAAELLKDGVVYFGICRSRHKMECPPFFVSFVFQCLLEMLGKMLLLIFYLCLRRSF